MSERRTAEIKFRCTPTFKASLAAAADAADQSLTEFIESAVGHAVRAQSQYGGPVASGFQKRTVGGTETECAPEAPPQTKCAGNCRPWEFCHCKAEA